MITDLKTHDERVKLATDNHTDLMELVYKMYMKEEVDFHTVIELLRESYTNQLLLLELMRKDE